MQAANLQDIVGYISIRLCKNQILIPTILESIFPFNSETQVILIADNLKTSVFEFLEVMCLFLKSIFIIEDHACSVESIGLFIYIFCKHYHDSNLTSRHNLNSG